MKRSGDRKSKKIILITALVTITSAAIAFAHGWKAPEEAAKVENPVSANEESIALGKVLFLDNCAYCHGDNARGMSAEDAGLEKAPPDLVKRLKNHTEGDLFWKIRQGKDEMPSFAEDLTEEEIWHIINFIKSEPAMQ